MKNGLQDIGYDSSSLSRSRSMDSILRMLGSGPVTGDRCGATADVAAGRLVASDELGWVARDMIYVMS
jgi:hypothetical protein